MREVRFLLEKLPFTSIAIQYFLSTLYLFVWLPLSFFSFSTVLAAPFFLWGRIRDNLQPLHYSVIGLKLFLDSETVKGAVLPVEKRAKVDALYDEDVAFRNFHEVQDALLK